MELGESLLETECSELGFRKVKGVVPGTQLFPLSLSATTSQPQVPISAGHGGLGLGQISLAVGP